nr:reverse transcriptase domain-containing protein [Tanacetum cinerariifolium]
MRTRSNFYPFNSTATIPRRSNRRRIPNIVEPEIRTIEEIVLMADHTMEELLQAPTEGYGEAIVILNILAENFEIKTNLLQLVQANKLHGFERDNPHTHISNFKRMTATLKYMDVLNDAIKLMLFSYSLEGAARICFFQNQPLTSGTLPSNTVPNPKDEKKAVTTRSGLAYEVPSIPTNSSLEKVDEQTTEEILDKELSNSSGSTAQVQPPVVPISIPEPDVPRTQTKPTIPYPFRLNDQKLREKATNQMEKFFQIFHDLHFDISFADALLLIPKFASTIKSLLANKDKLFELAKVPLNENCSAMLLKKLPEKLGDPELTPTQMTLELADSRSKSSSNPREVILENRSCFNRFIWRGNYPKGKCESITFNLNQTMRYSLTYDDNSVNRVDVIDIACEEFVQDVLDFQYNPKSCSPTLVSDASISENDVSKEPIVKSSSPTLTSFGESDFFLEEIKDFLNDDSIPTGIENSVYDPEGDILFLEKLLNEDPFQLPLMDLKLAEESKEKSSVEEPPELELKELSSHLEYLS